VPLVLGERRSRRGTRTPSLSDLPDRRRSPDARFVGTTLPGNSQLATSLSFASRLTALRRLLAMRMCPLRATASTGMCIRKHASGQTTKLSSQVYVLIRNAAATRRQCAWIDENESSRTRRTRLRLCAVGSEGTGRGRAASLLRPPSLGNHKQASPVRALSSSRQYLAVTASPVATVLECPSRTRWKREILGKLIPVFGEDALQVCSYLFLITSRFHISQSFG
jgi:hypothetical protein